MSGTQLDFHDAKLQNLPMLNLRGSARFRFIFPLLACFFMSSVASANLCYLAGGLPESYKRAREKRGNMDQLVRHAQVTKVIPNDTHLPILSNLVEPHLESVKKLTPPEGPWAAEFKALEAEALKTRKKNKVTYAWWIRFNAKLARILTSPDKRTPINEAMLQSLIDQFPKIILFPWVEGPEVSVVSEVQSFAMGAESLPLVSGPVQRCGKDVQPDELFAEGLKYAQTQLKAQQVWVDRAQLKKFHRFFMEELELRTVKERELALWVYWIATRVHTMEAEGLLESAAAPIVQRIFEDRREQLALDLIDPQKYGWLLPTSVERTSHFSVKSAIHESRAVFELIAMIANAQR